MSRINLGRVILGGIVAGIIIDIIEFVLNGIVIADRWPPLMAALHLPNIGTNAIIVFNLIGLVTGIAAVWAYAAIRPRFGSGPATAFIAAVLVFVIGYLLPNVGNTAMGVYPVSLALILTAVGLVEIVVATLAGAFIYKE